MATATSVQDRRRATIERMTGERPMPRAERRQRPRPPRRTVGILHWLRPARATPVVRPPLGPPSGVWYGIVAVVVVFVMLGLVMVLSASAYTEANLGNSPYGVFLRQATWAAIGLVGMVLLARIPFDVWRRFSLPLVFLAMLAMLVPLVPGIGGTVNGARAWVRIGPLSVQPSEFLKVVVVIATADLLTRRASLMNHRRRTLLPLALIGAIGAGLCLAQGDLGSAIVLGAIVFSIGWIAGVPFAPLALMGSVSTAAGVFFVMSSQTRIDRFTAFLDVTGNKDHLAWQTYQGFVSMASGGISGSGIGGSNTKLGYLPYAHSDFIFAIIADELGLLGAAAVIGGFVLLVGFGIQTALACTDRFGMLVAGGVASWFGVQAIVNLGGVTGLMPVTGLTLPFFSAGGTSLFVSMLAAGLLLSVARRVGEPAPTRPPARAPSTKRSVSRRRTP
ncbi:FtsW/RodA/SpoVE family cell cycle protein [Ilumatobacter nonamiensis]|uniref:FtsW/RodA/SpoVE family cell cycle protein n=1 Tax=Ilumatobacter nonamiensis TaxID=467093 RepID=UPI00034B4CD9|nr:putative peptidoglycan glycosyltransferase FtsW [Ilumatobacter nonamiensis]